MGRPPARRWVWLGLNPSYVGFSALSNPLAYVMPRITRRDFLNGVALTIASGLSPAAQVGADPTRYPPAFTGLRGQHAGSFEVAHAVGREGRRYPIDSLPIDRKSTALNSSHIPLS